MSAVVKYLGYVVAVLEAIYIALKSGSQEFKNEQRKVKACW